MCDLSSILQLQDLTSENCFPMQDRGPRPNGK